MEFSDIIITRNLESQLSEEPLVGPRVQLGLEGFLDLRLSLLLVDLQVGWG